MSNPTTITEIDHTHELADEYLDDGACHICTETIGHHCGTDWDGNDCHRFALWYLVTPAEGEPRHICEDCLCSVYPGLGFRTVTGEAGMIEAAEIDGEFVTVNAGLLAEGTTIAVTIAGHGSTMTVADLMAVAADWIDFAGQQ